MPRMTRTPDEKKENQVPVFNVGTDYTGSTTIPMTGFAGCRMRLEAGSAGAYEVWECEVENGVFGRSTVGGLAYSITLPAKPGWAELDANMFAAEFIRLVGGSGTSKVVVSRNS